MAKRNSLRIVGGDWRSRRIQFIDSAKIRPTPDRVRETLFNWLAAEVRGAKCLDLFAGSGALGFEAMSRGAQQAVLVEADTRIAATLVEQRDLFNAEGMEIRNQNALSYLQKVSQKFDLIFLDPPFASDLLEQVVSIILDHQLISDNGLLYIESPSQQEGLMSLESLTCMREKITGEVRYALYKNAV
ncbi:MAG: 16S rRNA (guanine(966)-N(2))-methyltransferase RsmD [Gammaproteobacteria bacterium]